MPADRNNPQSVMGGDTAGALWGINVSLRDGLKVAGRRRMTHALLPVPATAGPQPRQRVAVQVAGLLATSTPAGPAAFGARLRAINQDTE